MASTDTRNQRVPATIWKRIQQLFLIVWWLLICFSRADTPLIRITTAILGVVAVLIWLLDVLDGPGWQNNQVFRKSLMTVVIAGGGIYLWQAHSPNTLFFGSLGMVMVMGGLLSLLYVANSVLRSLLLHLGYLLLGIWWCVAVFARTSNLLLGGTTVVLWLAVTVEMILRARVGGSNTLDRYPQIYKGLAIIFLSSAAIYILIGAHAPNTWFFATLGGLLGAGGFLTALIASNDYISARKAHRPAESAAQS